jgi:hypothetical protein
MQGVLVFASEAARNAAITSPQEGQFAYTKDNNSLWYYTGSAWAASGATGDIEGVTAGVGISGGGTSGTVTITNSMATAIDAKGDLVAGTGADTFSRLGVGANNTVLTADSAEATGLKWAAAAGGGKVLQVVTANYGTAVINSTTTFADTGLSATITPAAASSKVLVFVSHTDSYRTGVDSGLKLRLMRDSTEVATNGTTGDLQAGFSSTMIFTTTLMYLDSPSTTSATTYKTQLANFTATASVRTNFNSTAGTSQIVLMEIGA